MNDDIGICTSSGTGLGRLSIGADSIGVSCLGHRILTTVNGRAVMSARSDKDLAENSAPVMGLMAGSMCRSSRTSKVSWVHGRGAAKLDRVLDSIKKNLRPLEVQVLEMEPQDESQESMPKQGYPTAAVLAKALDEYRGHLSEMGRNAEALNHLSGVLLKTSLEKSMWGSKDVTAVLTSLKGRMAALEGERSDLDRRVEHSDTGARIVRACVGSRESHAREAIGKVIENFTALKTYMSRLAQALHGLYDIDRVFKASTGWPATWFMDSGLFMDFGYEYDNLVNHMIRNAGVEKSVMEPLLAWRIRTTGEMNG